MINRVYLLETLKANDVTSASSISAVKDFLLNLKWREVEIDEAIQFLRTQGWLFDGTTLNLNQNRGTFFVWRKKIELFISSLFYKKTQGDVPKVAPFFNTMKTHVEKLKEANVNETPSIMPKINKKYVYFKWAKKIFFYIVISVILLSLIWLIYILRFDIVFIFRNLMVSLGL